MTSRAQRSNFLVEYIFQIMLRITRKKNQTPIHNEIMLNLSVIN